MAVRVHALRCAQCSGDLAGLPGDQLFCCAVCRRAYEPGADGWVGYDVHCAAPKEPAVGAFHLPTWRFEVTVEVKGNVSREQALAVQRWSAISHAWVPAFRLFRAAHHGDPGLFLTERRINPPSVPLERPLVGVARTAAVALRFVEPYLLSLIDRTADITGAELTVVGRDPQLWALPWAAGPRSVRDLLAGHELPNHTVDDLEAILRAG